MDENAEERGPHTDRKVVSSSEITTVTLECRHADNRYFVGEDAVIQGLIYNYDAVRDMAWKRKTDTGCHSKIDTTLPKYQGSTNDTLRPELMIRNCVESDAGPYFIQVSCTDMEICSKDFFLEVLKGPPLVALNNENKEEKAFLNESKEIRATIRGYPKYNDVIWMKDSQRLDITDPHYEGSQTDGMYAVLCINNVKIEDTGTYEIEVHNEEGKNCSRQTLKVIGGVPEVTLNKISPVHPKTCVTLEATIRNVFECDSVIWRKHDHSYHDPKFEFRVDINQNGSVVMRINDVRKEDAGTYTIEAHNKYGKGQSSKELKVIGGFPLVTIQKVPLAYLNDCVELKAKIKGFPKVRKVNWLKDNQKIDMTDTKYEGSKDDGDSAVLCIKDVEENDEAIYTVEVSNEFKKAERSQKLMVIREGQMIFISGPVVVSPSDTINFHVCMSSQTISNIQWWKINGVSKIEVEFDNVKYKLTKEGDNIYEFEITNAKSEDSGSYQCTADNMKSNTIYVYVNDSKDLPTSGQGNVIRFYALQAVSAKAMRKAIDRMPGRFHSNLQRAKTVCQSNKQHTWAKEFISISPNNSDGMDISKMYTMYRNLHQNSRQWGQPPRNNETFEHDDIERIRLYRNLISHSDAKEIKTPSFNKWMLDLLGAIQRLSRNDREVIKESCVILTRVFTTVEFKEKMEAFKEEPENLGLNILNEEEEIEETTFEEEIEMLNQTSLNKEHHGDTQRTDRSNRREETTFHDVCDSSIRISDDCTTATQKELYIGGVCFMNRPMEFEEEVHIRGKYTSLNLKNHTERINLKIGLTNRDPEKIRSSMDKKDDSRSDLKTVNCIPEENNGISEKFHLLISLCRKTSFVCTLAICLNENQQDELVYKNVSIHDPLWLAIDLDGIESIMISRY